MLTREQFNALPFLKSQLRPGETYEDLARLAAILFGIVGVTHPLITDGVWGLPFIIAQSNTPVTIGAVTTEQDLAVINIPAGMLESGDRIWVVPCWSYNNNANSKTLRMKWNGTDVYNVARTTSLYNGVPTELAFRASVDSQIALQGGTTGTVYIAAGVAVGASFSIATAGVAGQLRITGQKAVAGDTLGLEGYQVLLFKAPK